MSRSFLEIGKYGDSVVTEVIGWPHTTAITPSTAQPFTVRTNK
jgi:hypothetical protein